MGNIILNGTHTFNKDQLRPTLYQILLNSILWLTIPNEKVFLQSLILCLNFKEFNRRFQADKIVAYLESRKKVLHMGKLKNCWALKR